MQAHDTPLIDASRRGCLEDVERLLSFGAAVDEPKTDGSGNTPLMVASYSGHLEVVDALLAAGAAVEVGNHLRGITPLIAASQPGHAGVASMLLEAGAAANQACHRDGTAINCACHFGNLACAQLLSSHGATRTIRAAGPFGEVETAEQTATAAGHEELVAWLVESRQWSTPLHHLRIIGHARAREQLSGGADLHAAAAAGGPTPLSLARALRAAGDPDAAEGSAASLVLAAAEPWSPSTHALFPAATREYAVELLLLGLQLSRQPRFERDLVDVWTQLVMPSAVERFFTPAEGMAWWLAQQEGDELRAILPGAARSNARWWQRHAGVSAKKRRLAVVSDDDSDAES